MLSRTNRLTWILSRANTIPRLTKNNYSSKKKWNKTASEGRLKSMKGVYLIWERMDYSLLFLYILPEYTYTKAEMKK